MSAWIDDCNVKHSINERERERGREEKYCKNIYPKMATKHTVVRRQNIWVANGHVEFIFRYPTSTSTRCQLPSLPLLPPHPSPFFRSRWRYLQLHGLLFAMLVDRCIRPYICVCVQVCRSVYGGVCASELGACDRLYSPYPAPSTRKNDWKILIGCNG